MTVFTPDGAPVDVADGVLALDVVVGVPGRLGPEHAHSAASESSAVAATPTVTVLRLRVDMRDDLSFAGPALRGCLGSKTFRVGA
jgi:hypothetical protein